MKQDHVQSEHPDFLALELVNGSVRLSFNTGWDTASVTVGNQLSDGRYHSVSLLVQQTAHATLSIGSCQGICQGSVSTTHASQSGFSNTLYMGGVNENTPQIRSHFITNDSFVGCIKVRFCSELCTHKFLS